MNRFFRVAQTSIGMKVLMAASGLVMWGFLLGHLAGNLKVFFGPEEMNSYSELLRQHPGLSWPVRLVLLASVGLHIYTGLRLRFRNKAARLGSGRAGYLRPATLRATWASRTMVASGLLLASFIVYHLLHFTFLVFPGEPMRAVDSLGRHDVYSMIIYAFQSPFIAGGYVLAMGLLGLHLWHGAPSLLQTLGLYHSAYNRLLRGTVRTVVIILALGFCAIPVSIYLGLYPSAG
jgi:succinate dehydrogenase / fumarate reductase cytochrome b subunit